MKHSLLLCSISLVVILACWSRIPTLYLPVFMSYGSNTSAVLITGCSSGIGKHLAIDLAHEGYLVFATVRKSGDAVQFSSFSNVYPVIMDITSGNSISNAYMEILSHLEGQNRSLIGIINNAGVAHIAPVEYINLDMMRHVYEVNVVGVVAVTQKFLPLLRQSPGSRIINIGSVTGFFSPLFYGAYSASKFALEAVSDAMRAELRPQHIAVSIIQAGVITDTKIREKNSGENSIFESLPAEAQRRYGYRSAGKSESRAAQIEASGDSPQVVSTTVLHALQDRQPHPRYYAGRARILPGWALKMLSVIVPDTLLDKYIRVQPKG